MISQTPQCKGKLIFYIDMTQVDIVIFKLGKSIYIWHHIHKTNIFKFIFCGVLRSKVLKVIFVNIIILKYFELF